MSEGIARLGALLQQVDAHPLPTGTSRPLTEGLATLGLGWALYSEQLWPALTLALSAAVNGHNGAGLLTLADGASERGPQGYRGDLEEALYAVNCLDRPDRTQFSAVPGSVPEFERASPTFGRSFAYTQASCSSWPAEGHGRPHPLHAVGAAPIVVVSTTRDPATPYAWRVALARELRSGVLVTRVGDGHGGFVAGNRCVDRAVEGYLVGGHVPEDGLRC